MSAKVYKYKSRIVANWDRMPLVEGRVSEMDSVTIDKKVRRFIKVLTEKGEVQVFESAGLADLFDACAVGDFVEIEFLAMVQTKKDRNFRQFRSSCWTDEDAGPMEGADVTGKRRGRKARTGK